MSEEAKDLFLRRLRETNNVSASAEEAGFQRDSVYRWRKEDPEFARRFEDALEAGLDDLEQTAFEKAKNGWTEGVYYQGALVGAHRKFSPQLMMFLLERRRRARYGAHLDTGHEGAEDVAREVGKVLSEMRRLGTAPEEGEVA